MAKIKPARASNRVCIGGGGKGADGAKLFLGLRLGFDEGEGGGAGSRLDAFVLGNASGGDGEASIVGSVVAIDGGMREDAE